MKKFFIFTLCLALTLGSTSSFATSQNKTSQLKSEHSYIIVKGQENIKAYEKAGIIKSSPSKQKISESRDITIMGTGVPSSTWNLNEGSRSFDYSFGTYIYSSYKYLPCPDSLGSTGYGIYHQISPNSSQKMKLSFYNSNGGFEFSSPILDLDDVTAYGTAVYNKAYYIKYSSSNNKHISGSGEVY